MSEYCKGCKERQDRIDELEARFSDSLDPLVRLEIVMSEENKFKDKRGRTWEWFIDHSYYDDICVRCLDMGRNFNSPGSFHFTLKSDADVFIEMVKRSS